jgi:hypothetical protein
MPNEAAISRLAAPVCHCPAGRPRDKASPRSSIATSSSGGIGIAPPAYFAFFA